MKDCTGTRARVVFETIIFAECGAGADDWSAVRSRRAPGLWAAATEQARHEGATGPRE